MNIPITNEEVKTIANTIIGTLILEPQYRFVDSRLLAEIVRDTIDLVVSGKAL
jgi:hypothetical protein